MISQALMPKMLMDLGNKGQASELILKLIERFLDRINTTTIHTSVSEFSAICGGSLPPSPDKVTIALYSDVAGNAKEPCYNFQIDFFLTGVHNPVPVLSQPMTPASLAELYKIYKFAVKRVDGLIEYQTGIDLEKYAAAYFL